MFKPLSPDTQREIGRLAIDEELARLREKGFDLTVSEDAFEFLLRRGIHKTLGARPMKKAVQKIIMDAIRDAIKTSSYPAGIVELFPRNATLTIKQSTIQWSER